MLFGIVVFPGSNCDYDCYYALKVELGFSVRFLWHGQRDLEGTDCVILPGGFAYGDYLRAGAIARCSPIMDAVARHARQGRPVLGICNGFQILTEMGLLPGTLLQNENLRFVHSPIFLKIERVDTPFTHKYGSGEIVELPVAHAAGRYYAPPRIVQELEAEKLVLFRYHHPAHLSRSAYHRDFISNPNGSVNNIAGICNRSGNVMGLMPHPERRVNPRLGGIAGRALFQSLAQAFS